MPRRELPRERWGEELDSFSRQHEGWIVSMKTQGPDGRVAVEARDLPLQGVSVASPHSSDLAIIVGDRRSHLTHQIHNPAAVAMELTGDRAERALVIDGSDGTTTTIEFRSPVRPEEVDGIPASSKQ